MNLTDVGKLVAQSAPLLGSVLAGPTGATIGSLIAAKFGGNTTQPDALHALISTDPQAAIKLKALEYEHQLALAQLNLQAEQDEQQLFVSDRASARQRETDLGKTPTESHDPTPSRLAYALTIGVFSALFWVFVVPVPNQNKEIIYAIISCLTTVWVGAMAYYHGSSLGSHVKGQQLQTRLSEQKPGEGTPTTFSHPRA